ncbi:uncharacterized protein LOC133917073 isoform X2 [Phragmites australis]|uniref:uncharacterized protein LOC133917073 isoform X2 n=1 Tax=Phragmites australis TaxID=29695 RepID=UPI002D77A0D7|nr:uncharacterized protein LOC133917073 isoform X2 [Phragmites australis]
MELGRRLWLLLLLLLGLAAFAVAVVEASEGDADPLYKACVEECQRTGSLKETSVKHCMVPTNGQPADKSWYTHEPLYLQWKEWNCKSECRYHCMMERENERKELSLQPVKYHGKWPLQRASVFQEPLSAALSALTLVVQFNGWLSFFLLLYYKLPLSDTIWTEKLYFSSAAAFLGYSLILAILRTLNLRDEASRVMVAAPILAFVTTHVLYLNFYELDKGLNMKVCTAISISQFLLWALWAVMARHPSRMKIIFVAIGGIVSVFLEAYDIPPQWGYVDGRVICLAVAIPLSYLWWSFAKEDAEVRTSAIMKKTR